MIARHWRGWTEIQNADAYESWGYNESEGTVEVTFCAATARSKLNLSS